MVRRSLLMEVLICHDPLPVLPESPPGLAMRSPTTARPIRAAASTAVLRLSDRTTKTAIMASAMAMAPNEPVCQTAMASPTTANALKYQRWPAKNSRNAAITA